MRIMFQRPSALTQANAKFNHQIQYGTGKGKCCNYYNHRCCFSYFSTTPLNSSINLIFYGFGWISLFLLLWFPHSCLPQTKRSTRIVETAYGSLSGIIIPKSGSMPRDVEAYLGVPYASAPAATLRFMPPLTPSHWKEVRSADEFGPVCPQLLPNISNRTIALSKMPLLKYSRLLGISHLLRNQSEDCLYLNIYLPLLNNADAARAKSRSFGDKTQSSSNGTGLAVVVVLHGDSWEWGSGSTVDGSALASIGQVMVVTLNYRLGVLGFLQTSSQQGNFAIMDIVAALNWIHENGGVFGADVNRVTLLGHKTGAVLANFLMLAPVATELFHRVILLSGSSLQPSAIQKHSKGNVRKLAQFFKCISDRSNLHSVLSPSLSSHSMSGVLRGTSGSSSSASASESDKLGGGRVPFDINDHIRTGGGSSSSSGPSVPSGGGGGLANEIRDLAPCLRDIPLDDFLDGVNQQLLHPRFSSRFGPLIDNTVVKTDFVSEMKQDSAGHFSKIPLIIGTASIEAFSELNSEDIEDGLQESKRDRILRTLVRNIFVFHLNEIFSTIKNEYTDWEKPRKDFIDVRDSILNILSDGLSVAPLLQVTSMHAQKSKGKTYFFHFQYESDHSVYPQRIGSISEDLLDFSLGQPIVKSENHKEPPNPSFSSGDKKVATTLLQYLTNFICSGDPNSRYEGLSSIEDTQPPFWDSYDPVNQLYLEIGTGEPRMRSHYRGHKMALWLNLIPQLHQSGGADVSMLHHNFREERPEFYEGFVREQLKLLPPNTIIGTGAGGSSGTSSGSGKVKVKVKTAPPKLTDADLSLVDSDEHPEDDADDDSGDGGESGSKSNKNTNSAIVGVSPTLSPNTILSSSECPPNASSTLNSTVVDVVGNDRDLVRQLAASHYHSYGTALGVTIGVGCCLLLLNLLIFLAIYHQKTHTPPLPKSRPNEDENNGCNSRTASICRHHHHIHQDTVPHGEFPYGDEDFDEEELIREIRHHRGGGGNLSTSSFFNKEMSASSGFCSPPIPEPPPPPRSMPPSLAGSMISLASSLSTAAGGILRRQPEREREETRSCGGSMKKRVQIQEISV